MESIKNSFISVTQNYTKAFQFFLRKTETKAPLLNSAGVTGLARSVASVYGAATLSETSNSLS